MALPDGYIQAALIARFRADTALANLLGDPANPPGGIYDEGGPPTNTSLPVVIVYPIESQIGTTLAMGQDATDTYIQISIFTQPGASAGMKQARDIATRIYALFGPENPLDLSANGFAQFFVLFERKQEQEQPDGLGQQITLRFHLMTQTL